MKIAYFDCFAGISGDMCLGALIDAGVSSAALKKELKKIPINGYALTCQKVKRCGISATKVDVIISKSKSSGQKHGATKWNDIGKIIKASSLAEEIKGKGLNVFKKLFEAEAIVHGERFEDIHLHELGGIDCIVDIFGTIIGLEMLGVEQIHTSSINLGSGVVKTDHGLLPIPAPATAELLKGYPVYSSDIPFELTTPTGAAIMAGMNIKPYSLSEISIEKTGYGAGNKDIAHMPNTLRILVGQSSSPTSFDETVTVIETNIDDMNPQIYEDVIEKLFKAGALDVFLENIIMKRGRPAVKLNVIAVNSDAARLSDIIFAETTAIGLRYYETKRKKLKRDIKTVKTKFGDIRIKISGSKNDIKNISPEYADSKEASQKNKVPIKKIMEETIRLYCKSAS